jgi:beta-phosphoglucomutase-like phosphatase (HAD superfamily)
MFLGAARLLGLPPHEVVMVAAHIDDLRAAASYGLRTVYVRRLTEDVDVRETVKSKADGGEVDIVVDSLEELAQKLR